MKIKIGIEVNVAPAAVSRWLGLDGQDLLDAVKTAADSGDEVVISISTKKGVRILPLSTPPMFKGSDFVERGSRDER